MNECDDLSLVTWLETFHGFTIVSVKRTAMRREVFTVDRDITDELITAYAASEWKNAREQFHPPINPHQA
jgi:hypothetical protein